MRRLAYAVVLGATLLVAQPALADGVAPSAATPAQKEEAQARFLKGKDLFGKKQFDKALVEFNASHDIVASPNTRLYAARCLRESNQLVAAYAELTRTSAEAKELARDDPRYAKAAEAADDERHQLEAKLGFVQVTVAHPATTTTVKVGGEELKSASDPTPVAPGSTKVVVETPGHAPIEKSVDVAAGERRTVEIDAAADGTQAPIAETAPAPAPAEPKKNLRTMAYVAGGVGLVGLGMFTIFGLKANGTYSDLKSACNDGPCPPGHESDISAGKTQQTIANVGLVVGVLGAAAGVTLFVLSMPKKNAEPAPPAAWVTVGPSSVALEGAF